MLLATITILSMNQHHHQSSTITDFSTDLFQHLSRTLTKCQPSLSFSRCNTWYSLAPSFFKSIIFYLEQRYQSNNFFFHFYTVESYICHFRIFWMPPALIGFGLSRLLDIERVILRFRVWIKVRRPSRCCSLYCNRYEIAYLTYGRAIKVFF